MRHHQSHTLDRLHELLTDRALVGLPPAEEEVLQQLLAAHPEVREDAFDATVALLDVAAANAHAEPVPQHVRERLQRM